MPEVKFKYTTLGKYKALATKDEGTLYFLTNGQLYKGDLLISDIRIITTEFPDVYNEADKGHFFISLSTGEIRYLGDDGWVNISQLYTENVLLSEDNINRLIEAIGLETKTIRMPTLEADGTLAIWTPSNVTEVEVYVPSS